LAGTRGPRGRGWEVGWRGRTLRPSSLAELLRRTSEAPLPGTPGLDLAHRQKALGGDTLVGHDAEELAGGQAGICHEDLEVVTRGKTLPRLPRADGGNGDTQMLGDVLEGNSILPPPVAESGRKARADVTVKLSLSGHGENLRQIRVSREGRNLAT
jgi:hypothetical protein